MQFYDIKSSKAGQKMEKSMLFHPVLKVRRNSWIQPYRLYSCN